MKLTMDHLRFWRDRQPQPSWAAGIKRTQRPPTIHNLINSQTDERITSEPFNTLSILRSVRNRKGSVKAMLRQMSRQPNCQQATKRMAFCKKWLRRVEAEEQVWRDKIRAACHHSFPNWPQGWCVRCGFNLDEGR